jgi:elongation factor G
MTRPALENIRNIVLCGHSSSGKTTLVDHMLIATGAVTGHHSVDDGTSVIDFDPEEKTHKHTVEPKVAHLDYKEKRFNLVDTPGYPDFIGQTIGAMYGVDLAVVVINAHSGIEVNTRRVFDEAGQAGLARMIVVDKLDTDFDQYAQLFESIHSLWGEECVPLNVPVVKDGQLTGVASVLNVPKDTAGCVLDPNDLHLKLIEAIVESDEAVMEKYLEGISPTPDILASLMHKAIAEGHLVPILCCSGKLDIGLDELMDAIAVYGPAPHDIARTATRNGDEVQIQHDANGPLIARVFKTRIDPFVQKLSFIRVYSGTLKRDDVIPISGSKHTIKLGQLMEAQGAQVANIDSAGPGDIVAVAKMEELHTGTMLGEYSLPEIPFPTPMVGLAVVPKSRGDEAKISTALHKVVEEDPTFRLDHDPQTKELVMTGVSELQLTIIRERLHRRDHLEIDTKDPKIPFKETIQSPAEGSYRHKKQSGGRGQFGEVHIRMFPLPRGIDPKEYCTKERFHSMKEFHYDEEHNFLWVNSIVGGTIPSNFMPAIEKGFKERMARGIIAGYQVQDVCVEVHFGKYHDVDSSEAAFKTAASMAFRNVFQEARPSLLEPVVKMEITVPEQFVGDIYSDMSGRGGRVQGADAAGGGLQSVTCEAPLREVMHYARNLSSMTGGQGSFTMDFSHYDIMPGNVQQELMAKAKMHEEEEE